MTTLSCLHCHRWSGKGLVAFSFQGRISSLHGPRLVIAPTAIWKTLWPDLGHDWNVSNLILFFWFNCTDTHSLPDWAGAEKLHADGNYHWHAFVRFGSPLCGSNPRTFDIGDIHPNIWSLKGTKLDLQHIWLYLNKEGRPILGP